MNLLLHAIMHHPTKLEIVYLSLSAPWSYWAYEAISSDILSLWGYLPRLPPRAELFAEVQFCRRHIVSRFRSRFFNRRSCILVDTSSVRFGSVQCVPLPTNTATPTELQPDASHLRIQNLFQKINHHTLFRKYMCMQELIIIKYG